MRILLGALVCATTLVTGAAVGQDISGEMLQAHNSLRAKHGVPALSWSPSLAATAQDWANRCVFEHSNNGGENLAQWTSGAYSAASHVRGWYDEIRSYDFATGASKDGGVIGHFTQVVWKGTSEVGCGIAQCSGNDLLVCNYNPAGNWDGEYIANVPPPQ
jgi:pathogenesis-related protein 1